MSRIQPVDPAHAQGEAAEILTTVKKKMGKVPNILATMANSPAVANGYLAFSSALAAGSLPASLREQIALTVGESNQCQYCLSAHSFLGKAAGLSNEEIIQSRQGTSSDEKASAAVTFARRLADQRGNVTDEDIDAVRNVGFSEGEIGEIVAVVALNTFTNYFNHVADPDIDFPVAPELQPAH